MESWGAEADMRAEEKRQVVGTEDHGTELDWRVRERGTSRGQGTGSAPEDRASWEAEIGGLTLETPGHWPNLGT